MSTRIMSGPICRMSFQQIEISGSHLRKLNSLQLPGTMILQMHPLHSSNSRLQTLPSFLQSLILITSLFCNSENVKASPKCPFSISICKFRNSSQTSKHNYDTALRFMSHMQRLRVISLIQCLPRPRTSESH